MSCSSLLVAAQQGAFHNSTTKGITVSHQQARENCLVIGINLICTNTDRNQVYHRIIYYRSDLMSPNEVTEMWNCTFDFSLGLGKHTRRLKYTDLSLLGISLFLTSVSTIFSNCFTRFVLIFSIYFCSQLIPKPYLPILDECPSELPYSQTTAGATRPATCA